MKKIAGGIAALLLFFSTALAEDFIIHIPVDIDKIPNNGRVTYSNREGVVKKFLLKIQIRGCGDDRIHDKIYALRNGEFHDTIDVHYKYSRPCSSNHPQVRVYITYVGENNNPMFLGSQIMSDTSLAPYVVENVPLVRGNFEKVAE